MSGAPPSDYVNQWLPYWLRFSGEARARFEGFAGSGFRHSSSGHHLLTRIRVNLAVSPAPRLTFFAQMQDARVIGASQRPVPTSYRDAADLRMAYVEIGQAEKDPVTLRVGRQELFYGEQRLVGSNQWRNTAQTFDAARLTLRSGNLRFEAFTAAAVTMEAGFNRRRAGNNLHGLHAAIETRKRWMTVEPYLFWRLDPAGRTESGAAARFDARYAGAHVFGRPGAKWDYDAEIVSQTGAAASDSLRAWAGHWRAGYAAPLAGLPVRWVAEYNRATGDRNPSDGVQQLFRPPYPAVHDRFGLSDQIGWRNMHQVRTGAELRPAAAWLVAPNVQNYWVASQTDGVYMPNGTLLARVPGGSHSRRLGWEFDLSAQWKLSPLLELGFGWAHLFPGAFLREATPGVAYNSGYCVLSYRF